MTNRTALAAALPNLLNAVDTHPIFAVIVATTITANDMTAPPAPKAASVMVWEIRSKDGKRHGRAYQGEVTQGAHAEIVPGASITLFGMVKRYSAAGSTEALYKRTFRIGDAAEYDAYNLSYLGTIASITEKTVTIREDHDGRIHRLSLHEFNWRNRDLDIAETDRRNADVLAHC